MTNTTGTISEDLKALSEGRWPAATRRARVKSFAQVSFYVGLLLVLVGICWGVGVLVHHILFPHVGPIIWAGCFAALLVAGILVTLAYSNWRMRL